MTVSYPNPLQIVYRKNSIVSSTWPGLFAPGEPGGGKEKMCRDPGGSRAKKSPA